MTGFFIIDCTLVETPVCHRTHGYITGALIPVSPVSTVHQKNKMEKKAREKKVNKGWLGKGAFSYMTLLEARFFPIFGACESGKCCLKNTVFVMPIKMEI